MIEQSSRVLEQSAGRIGQRPIRLGSRWAGPGREIILWASFRRSRFAQKLNGEAPGSGARGSVDRVGEGIDAIAEIGADGAGENHSSRQTPEDQARLAAMGGGACPKRAPKAPKTPKTISNADLAAPAVGALGAPVELDFEINPKPANDPFGAAPNAGSAPSIPAHPPSAQQKSESMADPHLQRWFEAEARRSETLGEIRGALKEIPGAETLEINEFYLLYCLSQEPEKKLKQVELLDRLQLSLSAISRLVARLEAKDCGVIKRVRCRRDKRSAYIVITPCGEELFSKISRAVETRLEAHFRRGA